MAKYVPEYDNDKIWGTAPSVDGGIMVHAALVEDKPDDNKTISPESRLAIIDWSAGSITNDTTEHVVIWPTAKGAAVSDATNR